MKLLEGPKAPTWFQIIQLMGNTLGYLEATGERYGDIFTLPSPYGPAVFVSNPQGLKEIFTNTKEITAPSELNRTMALLSGNKGILQLDGLRHKHRRKLLMPAFYNARIRAYGQRICDLTKKVIQQKIGKSFLVFPTMEVVTLQVFLEVVLGLHEGERYQQLCRLISSLLDYVESPLGESLLNFPALQQNLGRWSPWGHFLYLQRKLKHLFYAEINERRQQAHPPRTDLLYELMSAQDEAGEPLTDDEVYDLILAPLFAGRDAVATAIAWSLYWTHFLPPVRDKLLEELDGLGESPDPMSIAQLPYLTAVCNESLRLYPTQVMTFPRRVESPIELMGYELSPGTVLIGNIYLTHQRKDLYPEPKQFKPERFLERQFSPYEFLPFGGGARSCLGGPLVMFEMKLALATLLSSYQLALAKQQPLQPQRRGINFPPSNFKMVVFGQRQGQGQLQQINAHLTYH